MPRLTAIVPATNGPATLPLCLAAIHFAQETPEEVIVVKEPSYAGPAQARNEGAQRASGEVLVFVDADVVVHPDVFARIREAFEAEPGLTALFGSYDDTPPADGLISSFRNLLHYHVHQDSPGAATTFWAGLGAIRRDVFLDAGGFDAERFPHPSVEDIDLGMRLASRGKKIELDPNLQATHLKVWTLAEMVRTDFARRGVPWVALLLRSGSSSTALNLHWRHRLSALTSLAAVAGLGTRRPAVVVTSLLGLVSLNHRFYGLLARKRGLPGAGLGVGLHALHHLTAVAAAPVGMLSYYLERRDQRAHDARVSAVHQTNADPLLLDRSSSPQEG